MPAGPFHDVVGPDHVRCPEGEALDGTPVSFAVRPGNAEEVAGCLAEARERGFAVVPVGSGTKLAQANRIDAAAVVRLELSRLDRIESLDAREGVAVVQAGVRVDALASRAREQRLRTLIETPHPAATVGGTIAAAALAPEHSLDRRVAHEVLGLQTALANGTLARAGGRVVKNVTGFDLVRLYTGSLGTLGVLTEATLRLRPVPEARAVARRYFPSLEAALASARELLDAPVAPAGLAALPEETGASLVSLYEGVAAEIREAVPLAGEAADEAAWDAVGARMVAPAPGVRLRLAARPADTLEIARGVEADAGRSSLCVLLPVCGIVIANLSVKRAVPVLARAAREGWASVIESAPLEFRADVDVFGREPGALPLMRELKCRFDPGRVVSPGRFVGGI